MLLKCTVHGSIKALDHLAPRSGGDDPNGPRPLDATSAWRTCRSAPGRRRDWRSSPGITAPAPQPLPISPGEPS